MKKIIAATILFASMMACTRAPQPAAQDEMKTVTITAASPVLKGTVDKDRYYTWSSGDRILVEVRNGPSTTHSVFTTYAGGDAAVFVGSIPSGASVGSSAYYPADAVTVSGDKVTFKIEQSYNSASGEFKVPLVASRWGHEAFAFTPAAGAVKITYNNVDASFGNMGTVVFQATEATNGTYELDKESGKLLWNGSGYSARGKFSDASKISVKAVVSQGRSIFAYVPLPENSAWGDIRITLMDESGKVFQENDVPEGTVVPVEAGRITRLPAVTFPAEIYFALDPSDNDFSLWNSYPNLNPDRKWSPWTWRGSWMGEYVYSHDEENTPCKEVKLFSDEKYIYGYVKVDLDLRHYSSGDKMNTDPMLNNFYVMIDNDDVTTGQSFGGNNIANVPTYRGYNLMLYGKACTGSVPGEWRPSCYDCTVDAGASNTNFRGELLEDVLDAAYGGGSVDGDILQWEFIIDKSKVGLFGRTTHNICISFCDSPNSNNTMMPSISGIVIDL